MEIYSLLKNSLKGRDRFLPSTTPSKRAEVYYREALADFIRTMVNRITDALSKKNLVDAVAISDDDYINAVLTVMSSIASERIEEQATLLATRFVTKVHYQNKSQYIRNFKNAFSVDLSSVIEKEVLDDTLKLAIENNVNLITSIKNDFINDIGSNVFDNYKRGFRHTELISEIRERGNVTYSRAKLIARDQTAKINSDFDEARNRRLGFDVYKWSGTGDQRQRKSHKVLNNMLCKYSDPDVYSDDDGQTWKKRKSIGAFCGKCGEDIQCRCRGLAYIKF